MQPLYKTRHSWWYVRALTGSEGKLCSKYSSVVQSMYMFAQHDAQRITREMHVPLAVTLVRQISHQ